MANKIKLSIEGMHCEACVRRVTNALNAVEGVRVESVEVGSGVAETYDVIVKPSDNTAYTIFAQAEDRTGFARGTLTPRIGLTASVPPMDPRPKRTMMDKGMGNMSGMKDMQMVNSSVPQKPPKSRDYDVFHGCRERNNGRHGHEQRNWHDAVSPNRAAKRRRKV
jgi:FtsP/CotA-like multicopper oxidase with cupredoxin domain